MPPAQLPGKRGPGASSHREVGIAREINLFDSGCDGRRLRLDDPAAARAIDYARGLTAIAAGDDRLFRKEGFDRRVAVIFVVGPIEYRPRTRQLRNKRVIREVTAESAPVGKSQLAYAVSE